MGKWNAKIDGVLLSTFFETGVADPRHTTAADIDPIKEMDDTFAEFSNTDFWTNYKKYSPCLVCRKSCGRNLL